MHLNVEVIIITIKKEKRKIMCVYACFLCPGSEVSEFVCVVCRCFPSGHFPSSSCTAARIAAPDDVAAAATATPTAAAAYSVSIK